MSLLAGIVLAVLCVPMALCVLAALLLGVACLWAGAVWPVARTVALLAVYLFWAAQIMVSRHRERARLRERRRQWDWVQRVYHGDMTAEQARQVGIGCDR